MRNIFAIYILILTAAAGGCSDTDSACAKGSKGCGCYPNDTCNRPYLCMYGTCQDMNHYDGPDLDKDVSEIDKEKDAENGEETEFDAEAMDLIEADAEFIGEELDESADEAPFEEPEESEPEIEISPELENEPDAAEYEEERAEVSDEAEPVELDEEPAVEEEIDASDETAEDEADKMETVDIADGGEPEEEEEPQVEEESEAEYDAEPEPEPEPDEIEEHAEYDAEIPETPRKGVYEYALLEIGGLKEVERVEFHPSGDYFAALEMYNVVHVYDWNAGKDYRFDLSGLAQGTLYLNDLVFDQLGRYAIIVGSRYYNSAYEGLVFKLDDAGFRAYAGGDTTAKVIGKSVIASKPYDFRAIEYPPLGGLPVVMAKGGTSSNPIVYLYEFDPDNEALGDVFAATATGTGCNDMAFADNEFGKKGILIVCGENGADVWYYTWVGGVGEWRNNPGNSNLGNMSRVDAHLNGDYALIIGWSGRKVHRFQGGQLNTNPPGFSAIGIWGIKFQQLGQRALIVGQAGVSPVRATIVEYRHDKYSCQSITGVCDFSDVSIPNVSIDLNDAAFRPYCDGGVVVGGKSDYQSSSGKIYEFSIIGGASCHTTSGGN